LYLFPDVAFANSEPLLSDEDSSKVVTFLNNFITGAAAVL